MFILSKNKECSESINFYLNALNFSDRKKPVIYEFSINHIYYLAWVSLKPSDNFHIFQDGYYLGKLDFDEKIQYEPIFHKSLIPISKNPLLSGVEIKINYNEISIKPNEQSLVYYSKNSISDFQLLIAKNDSLYPSPNGVAILSSIGYFPGKLSLFDEIETIPYLETLSLPDYNLKRHDDFNPKINDDNELIMKLKNIIPKTNNTSIALSGGLDSRFILGLLNKVGLEPKVYTLSGSENKIVKFICESLNLELEVNDNQPLSEYKYSLMTDARIYYRGGNYSKMCSNYTPDEILHVGIWSDPIIENAFKSSWKMPTKVSSIYKNFIWYNLLQRIRNDRVGGLRDNFSKSNISEFLYRNLSFQKTYYEFSNRIQWARWFYHVNRGLNWSNAFLSDASFFIYPVFLLGNKEATQYGITSPAYANFAKERLRCMNRMLLPNLKINYSDNRKYQSYMPLINDLHKIYYEYVKSLIRWSKNTSKTKMIPSADWFADCNNQTASNFGNYFTNDLDILLSEKNIQVVTKRAAVTVNNVLRFLDEKTCLSVHKKKYINTSNINN